MRGVPVPPEERRRRALVGGRVFQALILSGHKQADLARGGGAGVVSMVSYRIRGKAPLPPEFLVQVADLTGVTVECLLDLSGPPVIRTAADRPCERPPGSAAD